MKSVFIIASIYVFTLSFTASANEPVVSNRTPKADEVHYFPADGGESKVNPPGFVWLPEDSALTYQLQCSSREDFSLVEYQAEDISLNVHCPPNLFKPGTWHWRYAYTTKDGETSGWSQSRTFTIQKDAPYFPQPALPQLVEKIPKLHPKLFIRPENLDAALSNLFFNFTEHWENFLAAVKKELPVPLVTEEPPPYPSGGTFKSNNQADVDVWRGNRSIVVPAVERAANLAFAYLMTSNEEFGIRAKEIVMEVMKWDPHGTTGWVMNDEIAMPVLSCVSRVYTWAYASFSDDERKIVIACMTERARDAYNHLIRTQHTVHPYGSHNNRSWHFLGETAIAFMDDIPEAKTWLKYAVDVFYCVYPVWSDMDGGWHEGVPYWNSYISRVTWWLDIVEQAFGINGFKNPYFQHSGDFPLYVNPPGSEFAGFGDMADTHSWKRNQPLMAYLAYKTQNEFWQAYAEYETENTIPENPTYYDLLRLHHDKPPAKPVTGMPPSKVFEGAGIASLHSYLGMNSLDTHLLFKSSPYGSQSHGFNAQNSFVLWREGLPVLHWSGHRDWHGSGHHKEWMWETHSDNSITVNGMGQIKHSAEAKGRIAAQFLQDDLDYVAGDASKAYGDCLTKFVRHIVFLKPDMFFMVDELEAPEPSTFTFHLHASEPFLFENQYALRVANQSSGVRLSIAAPANLDVTQTNITNPAPVNWDKEQWHFTAETTEQSTKQTFITLMKTFSSREMANIQVNKFDIENLNAFGFQINQDKYLLIVINDARTNYTMQDTRSDAYMTVLYTNTTTEKMVLFAVDASFLTIAGETMLQSDQRTNFLVPENKLKQVFKQYAGENANNQ